MLTKIAVSLYPSPVLIIVDWLIDCFQQPRHRHRQKEKKEEIPILLPPMHLLVERNLFLTVQYWNALGMPYVLVCSSLPVLDDIIISTLRLWANYTDCKTFTFVYLTNVCLLRPISHVEATCLAFSCIFISSFSIKIMHTIWNYEITLTIFSCISDLGIGES